MLISVAACDVMQSTQIEQAVVKALAADPRTAEYTFEVSFQGDGEVLITGEIFKPEEADYVTEVAMEVKGVTHVLNRVHVEEFGSGMLQDEVVPSPFL
jgi:osmotically-inducible protein OsmY